MFYFKEVIISGATGFALGYAGSKIAKSSLNKKAAIKAKLENVKNFFNDEQGAVDFSESFKNSNNVKSEPIHVKDAVNKGGTTSGYYQDATGKWHRANGQFASNAEVGLPGNSDHYLNRPYIRQETINVVNSNTKVNYKTGQIYDSISRKWVDPSNVELGHTSGNEFSYYRNWLRVKE